jgi:hypothetical protein
MIRGARQKEVFLFVILGVGVGLRAYNNSKKFLLLFQKEALSSFDSAAIRGSAG